MALASYSVPGVYRQPQPRQAAFPRVRTDVAGFVGVAGPRRVHEAVRLDDWRSYVDIYLRDDSGDPVTPPAGAALTDAVHAFFANGGARCWVVNVAEEIQADHAQELLNDMLGLSAGTGRAHPGGQHVGLERLLLEAEVSVVVLPELDATVVEAVDRSVDVPPLFEQGQFHRCERQAIARPGLGQPPPALIEARRLYTEKELLWAQRYLIGRCQRERWRVFALLATPPGKNVQEAVAWRELLTAHLGGTSAAALYWPWVLVQTQAGAPVEARSPVGHLAGVVARLDLAAGPHAAPANATLRGVIGTETPIDDDANAAAYDRGVNVLRALPRSGVTVWGARSLAWQSPDVSSGEPLAYVNVRRCLSAIERSVERVGQPAVFEPNLPLLRAQLAQAIIAYLSSVFESGALLGRSAEEAFFVRCDSALNPPEATAQGQLLCEVGVAIAAPAEFIVFRVGRNEGVVEIQEVE
jgi:uncharacterized protein